MFNGLTRTEDPADLNGREYLATVVANDDPLQQERVKFTIAGLVEEEPDLLPWAVPNVQRLVPGAWNLPPPVSSIVVVKFRDGDPHFPVWEPYPVVTAVRPEEAGTDYPFTYGFKDPAGNLIMVNTKDGSVSIKIQHVSGSGFTIDNAGKFTFTSVADMDFSAVNINMTTTQDLNITTGGVINAN